MSMHHPLHNHQKMSIDHTSYTEAVAESIEYRCVMMAGLKFPGSILTATMEFENIFQFPGILQNWVNEANMSQLAQEKQVNWGTSARLNALSQYVLRISFSVAGQNPESISKEAIYHGTLARTSSRYQVF